MATVGEYGLLGMVRGVLGCMRLSVLDPKDVSKDWDGWMDGWLCFESPHSVHCRWCHLMIGGSSCQLEQILLLWEWTTVLHLPTPPDTTT
jgi:hypothetical protein